MNSLTKSKTSILVFHLLVWLMLFTFPYLLSSGQSEVLRNVMVHSWIPLCFYIVLFYTNYFILIERFLFPKKTLYFVIINVVLVVLFLWLSSELKSLFMVKVTENQPSPPPKRLFYYIDFIAFTVPIIFSVALKTTEKWIKTEALQKEAQNQQLQSELKHLKYQLQPHFFFNSLNNIYALVDVSPEKAKDAIHSLSKLMRYFLYETELPEVNLNNEISFMTNYIELMKLRFGKNVKVNYSFPQVVKEVNIAPFLFISLIENAFKHGLAASEETTIDFEMKLEDNTLVFKSKNRNFPKTQSDTSGSGIGLENLKRRLALLYSNKNEFTLENKTDYFTATLVLNLEK